MTGEPQERRGESREELKAELKADVSKLEGMAFTSWGEFVIEAKVLKAKVDRFNSRFSNLADAMAPYYGADAVAHIKIVDASAELQLLPHGVSYTLELMGSSDPKLRPLFYRDVFGVKA